ncbi:serine-tRNA(Ala) deacylase [Deinococcus malanensis]|uniref:Serine-tRNA(Ala) deacylase n=1 Tax=Deinococcus malanensis TaxID=1706855 RepID=A0ABQ2ENW9_9DEIO|nr:alanyl-tRNA editing protein [Deinococcus malanensis]GGK14509.1 serine-tRNA(Ala) deacylase [Deinococcus malanensis]
MTLAATRPLYHEDPAQLTFAATVLDVQAHEIALDATAFYPEGGGQNTDIGVLRWSGTEARMVAARKDKTTGVIWHALAGDLPPPGTVVTGEVDAAVRWRHAQRHSGEHLLAQTFARVNPVFQVAAVSMRSPECTLDLRGDPAESHVRAAEALLRETLGRRDLQLHTPTVAEDQLSSYPLRRETQVRGQVRLVIFQEPGGAPFDVSACGGTHVPRAGLAAPVVILRTERQKAGLTRVVFMAGEEAAEYLSGVYHSARTLAQGFSVPVERLPERVAALTAERDTLRVAADVLREQLAGALLEARPLQAAGTVPLREIQLDAPELLAPLLARVPTGTVVVAYTPQGRCGVGSALPGVNAGEVLRTALARAGGKGGGRAELAQGNTGDVQLFSEAVRETLAGLKPDPLRTQISS